MGASSDKGCRARLDTEFKRLQRELADAHEENDILKKSRLTLRETSGEVSVYLSVPALLLGVSNVPGEKLHRQDHISRYVPGNSAQPGRDITAG